MPSPRFPIPQGTLDMLILQILSLEPAAWLRHRAAAGADLPLVVQVNQGSLYPALHRLEQKGWLRAEWKQSETGREAKFYSLTPAGRRQLARREGQLGAPLRRRQPDLRGGQPNDAALQLVPPRVASRRGLDRELHYHCRPPRRGPRAVRHAGARGPPPRRRRAGGLAQVREEVRDVWLDAAGFAISSTISASPRARFSAAPLLHGRHAAFARPRHRRNHRRSTRWSIR